MMDSRIMVDLHCHILSGMDDGARSVEESLAMAEMAISDGITHVVATPHSNNEYRFDFAAVRQASMDLQRAVGDRRVVDGKFWDSGAAGCSCVDHARSGAFCRERRA